MGQHYKNLENKADNCSKRRILFVNDEDTIAVIKEGLTRHGLEVETFVDPESAIQS